MKKLILLVVLYYSSCAYPEIYHELSGPGDEYLGIELISTTDKIETGESAGLSLYGINPSGIKSMIANEEAEWSIDNPLVAEISAPGLLSGISPGGTRVTASYGCYESHCEIEVTRGISFGDIIITEVLCDPDGSDTGREFIEVANISEYDISLDGLYLIDGSNSSAEFFFSGVKIPAAARAIAAADRDMFFTDYGFYPSIDGLGFALNNSGESIFLYKADGILLDEVFISGGTTEHPQPAEWGATSQPASTQGLSVQRINLIDTDTGSDWHSTHPSPGE